MQTPRSSSTARPVTRSGSVAVTASSRPSRDSARSANTCQTGKTWPGSDGNRSGIGDPSSVSTTPRQPVVSYHVTDDAPLAANAPSSPHVHAAPSNDACRTSTAGGTSPGAAGPAGYGPN